jgi:hypothetical protein
MIRRGSAQPRCFGESSVVRVASAWHRRRSPDAERNSALAVDVASQILEQSCPNGGLEISLSPRKRLGFTM